MTWNRYLEESWNDVIKPLRIMIREDAPYDLIDDENYEWWESRFVLNLKLKLKDET